MALKWHDRILETSTTTGTGALTLAGAVTGFKTFASRLSTNDTCYYSIEGVDAGGTPTGEWETGLGTYSGVNTLTRTTVSESSNGDVAVNFSAGTKRVMLTALGPNMAGRLIGKQTITATGAGTYTPTTGTQSIVIELQGAGGGGGGVASPGASNVARAFAGLAGGYLRKRLTANFSGASYSVGAKGTGGSAGNNNGNNGGDTTFTDTAGSPTVYTASGGAGGSGSTGFAPPLAQAGSAGAAATNGDINIQGGPTKPAVALATTALIGAGGGDAHLGFGAAQKALTAAASTSNGNNAAAGYGGGGGGGIATTTGAAASGGDGANGVIIIWEYS